MSANRILVKDVRQSFMCYWKAEPFPNGNDPTPYFSGTYLLPLDHPQLKDLEKIINDLAKEKWPGTVRNAKGVAVPKWIGILAAIKAKGKCFLRDGDTKPEYDGFPGMMFISSRSKIRPNYFDWQKQPIDEASGILYSGCYVNVSIECFAYTRGNNGIGARLRGVQFLRKGDAFGGGGPPADETEFDEIDAPADEEEGEAATDEMME
jgi:hypothetical protein